MTEWVDWAQVQTAVECGPGTGAVTGEVLKCLRPGSRFFAVELHPGLGELFRTRFPDVDLVQGSVADLPRLCMQRGLENVDCVVSSLPWASFSPQARRECLEGIAAVLPRGGQFVTFAYLQGALLPGGKRFQRLLGEMFSEVGRSRITWMNFPPAFVYRCRR